MKIYIWNQHTTRAGNVVADLHLSYGDAEFDSEGNPLHTNDFSLWGSGTEEELVKLARDMLKICFAASPSFQRMTACRVLESLGYVTEEEIRVKVYPKDMTQRIVEDMRE